MNRERFYNAIRPALFRGRLSAEQVTGMEGILDAFVQVGDGRDKTLAYALATAYHETGRKMVPVREGFAKTDAGARRIVRNRTYGKPVGPYRHVYYGRGHVQLTWLENYRRSSADAGVDLVKYPDKALDPVFSARLLILGLMDGRWNGHGLGLERYLPTDGPDDVRNARRTVNITDKWRQIGAYYQDFLLAIRDAGGVPVDEEPAPIDPVQLEAGKGEPPVSTKPVHATPERLVAALAVLIGAVAAAFGGDAVGLMELIAKAL